MALCPVPLNHSTPPPHPLLNTRRKVCWGPKLCEFWSLTFVGFPISTHPCPVRSPTRLHNPVILWTVVRFYYGTYFPFSVYKHFHIFINIVATPYTLAKDDTFLVPFPNPLYKVYMFLGQYLLISNFFHISKKLY